MFLNTETDTLIIIYHYIYSELSNTVENIVWNSIELIKDTGFGPQVDKWLE